MRKLLTRTACLALPILLAGCLTNNPDLRPQPSLDQLSTDRAVEQVTAVDITQRCRQLTARKADPQDYVGKNVYASRAEWKAKAELTDFELAAADKCIETMAHEYAKGLHR